MVKSKNSDSKRRRNPNHNSRKSTFNNEASWNFDDKNNTNMKPNPGPVTMNRRRVQRLPSNARPGTNSRRNGLSSLSVNGVKRRTQIEL